MVFEGNIFTPNLEFVPGKVETENNIITKVTLYEDGRRFDNYVIPGLIDVHVHGAMGCDFCDATKESFETIARYERDNGIVAFAASTMTLPEEKLSEIMKCARNVDIEGFKGIYLEGPFISINRKGAQKLEYIKKFDAEMVNRLNDLSGGRIKYVLTAPDIAREPKEYEEFINAVNNHENIRFTIGHSDADYICAMDAFSSGASEVTHMYNAMSAFDKRSPGILGASMDSDAYVEIITDKNHVHPSAVRMTFNAFKDDRVLLISDSMMATGMPNGEYTLGEQKVLVEDSRATLQNGTLAGSVTNLKDCFLNAISMGVSLKKAVMAVTYNPAHSLGIYDNYGSIEPGKNGALFNFTLN